MGWRCNALKHPEGFVGEHYHALGLGTMDKSWGK